MVILCPITNSLWEVTVNDRIKNSKTSPYPKLLEMVVFMDHLQQSKLHGLFLRPINLVLLQTLTPFDSAPSVMFNCLALLIKKKKWALCLLPASKSSIARVCRLRENNKWRHASCRQGHDIHRGQRSWPSPSEQQV
ncbi:hypothetical protein CEXT_144451 [Caerostris extrusa]|uniref:Uncharacterized protein n=1 Tax=Caerostris extrusa TaxID=172846 RepID=A0AAV4XB63_CAEEX|nr:hypothetical protein CEXT_144451 [Caerostris extrusa]